jgi:TRAP-type C4-dicarboxylate transport system substrate-binding protein
VQTGQAQVGEVLISIHENEDPLYGLDVVPFLATSYEQAKKLYEAQRPAFEKKLGSQGLMLLFAVPWGPQGIYAKKDLNTVDDMKGMRWRAYNAGTARIAELTGMQSVTIQAAELPQALATGVVNSFMSSGSTGYDSKAWETLTHFYDTQAWLPKNIIFVNKAAFDALDKPTQDAVMNAAKTAEERGWKVSQEKTQWYLDQLKAKGMKVQNPSPELASGFRKVGEQLTADWLKKAGADGQAVVDAYKKSAGCEDASLPRLRGRDSLPKAGRERGRVGAKSPRPPDPRQRTRVLPSSPLSGASREHPTCARASPPPQRGEDQLTPIPIPS